MRCDVSVSDIVCVCSCVHVCANMLMTLFFPHAHFSSFLTCMRCGVDACTLIGATATSTNEAFFLTVTRTQKNGRFSITDFFFCMWSRQRSYDPISLKPHFGAPHAGVFAFLLPLSSRTCWCGRHLDCLGHHRASCSRVGVLGRRGFALESAAARICVEAGARVSTNVFLRDLDLSDTNCRSSAASRSSRKVSLRSTTPCYQSTPPTCLPFRADGAPHRRCGREWLCFGSSSFVARSARIPNSQVREVAPSWWFSLARSDAFSPRRRTPSFAPSSEPRFDRSRGPCALGRDSPGCTGGGPC